MARSFVSGSTGVNSRPKSKDEAEKGIWSGLLDSVATGKKLPEKHLFVLGGTVDSQKEFLQSLETDSAKGSNDRYKKRPPIANKFALGYTYQNVLDADHEDILARLSIHLLSEPAPSYVPLLQPLFTSALIPQSLLVLLLDWNEPWSWIQQLRDWIILIRAVTASLGDDSKLALEETMKEWQERRRGTAAYDSSGAAAGNDSGVTIPLSQGEWDEPLGLPLCVVCQNANNINNLEAEKNWREEDFDFVLQSLRTVLMKHGASLIYTSSSTINSLPTLIHSSLDIHSTLKRQALKHNVIDREKILVPPNWDSWGKIRVIREGFDVEGVSSKWETDISQPLSAIQVFTQQPNGEDKSAPANESESPVVQIYGSTVSDPHAEQKAQAKKKPGIEVVVPDMQTFLASQQDTLARLAIEDEKTTSSATSTSSSMSANTKATSMSTHDRMADQIGPVQVNMGGIQVDADDIVRKLQRDTKKDSNATPEVSTPKEKGEGSSMSTPDMKAQNEALQSFFSGLLKRGQPNSPRGTPSKAPPKETTK